MSFVLGVTGGIASGKSTVVDFFKAEGFPVVDGDIIAREVVEPGTEGLMALEKVFGKTINSNPKRKIDVGQLRDVNERVEILPKKTEII